MSESSSPSLTSKRISPWIPLAAFAGTSIALALPLVFLAKKRNSVLRKALSASTAAPPRRSAKSSSSLSVPRSRSPTSDANANAKSSSQSHFSSPTTGELLSAMSSVDYSTAVYAGKAFAIATGIVTVGGTLFTLGVKWWMGVEDTKEFAERMRMMIWRTFPSLTSQIHRPPSDADSSPGILSHSPHPSPSPSHIPPTNSTSTTPPHTHTPPTNSTPDPHPHQDPHWTWDSAEKRLKQSFEDGGFPAFVQTAIKEMEEEIKVERARREKAYGYGYGSKNTSTNTGTRGVVMDEKDLIS